MIPTVRRNVFNNGGDSISDICFETSRISNKPIEDNCAVCPYINIGGGDMKHFLYMTEKLCKQVSTT